MVNLLEEIEKKFDELPTYVIQIGVFSEKSERKDIVNVGINNAELMFIHENGSPLNNIPSRPVLQMTLDYANKYLLPKTIDKCTDIFLQSFEEQKIEEELERLCMRMQSYARRIIYSNDGRLAPNAPSTIKAKGNHHALFDNHPLFDTGQLARSITCKLVKV